MTVTITDTRSETTTGAGTPDPMHPAWDALTIALGLLGETRERASATAHGLDDTALEGGLRAAEAIRRAADGLELTFVAEVNRRGEERGDDGWFRDVRLGPGEVADMASDTVAIAVGAGPWEAGRRCGLAARATTDLADLADLAGDGRLRQRALEVVESHTRDTLPETTAAIVAHFLEPMRGRPGSIRILEMEPREIAKACRRLIARLEPDVMQRRADSNRAEKLDVRTEPGLLGTTTLSATLPSEVGAAVRSAVDAAGLLRLDDDPDLPIGTARALGLTDLVLRGVTVSAEVRLGIPVIASAASRLTFAPMGGDEATTGDGSSRWRIATGTGADRVAVLDEEWLPGGRTRARVPARVPDTADAASASGSQAERWVSGTTIPGVGFVPPDVVAALVGRLDTRVARALLDARTGTLLETSAPRYVIPAAQREFVTTRDGVCRMWGCTRPVHTTRLGWKADVDHATPWPEGETSPCNLSALCRHHHRVKHSPRWRHVLHEDGTSEWVTPGGVPAFTFPTHAVPEDTGVDDEDARPVLTGGWDPTTGAWSPLTETSTAGTCAAGARTEEPPF